MLHVNAITRDSIFPLELVQIKCNEPIRDSKLTPNRKNGREPPFYLRLCRLIEV